MVHINNNHCLKDRQQQSNEESFNNTQNYNYNTNYTEQQNILNYQEQNIVDTVGNQNINTDHANLNQTIEVFQSRRIQGIAQMNSQLLESILFSLKKIESSVNEIKNEQKEIKNEQKEIKNEQKEIKNEQKEIKNEQKEIKNQVKNIKDRVRVIEESQKELKNQFQYAKRFEQRNLVQTFHCVQQSINRIPVHHYKRHVSKKQAELLLQKNFYVKQQLGKGSFGKVFLVQQKMCGSIYALKLLSKQYIKRHNLQKYVIQQIRITYFHSHPNIVKLYAVFSDQKYIYLVMEFAGKQNMESIFLKNPQFRLTEIIYNLVSSITFIHNLKYIYRDIKPSNILFHRGHLKVCDFGLAADIKQIKNRNLRCGTLLYNAPQSIEVWKNDIGYNEKVDIWSMGVVLYQLVYGKNPMKPLLNVWNDKINFNVDYPPQLQNHMNQIQFNHILSLMLERDPNLRASGQHLKHITQAIQEWNKTKNQKEQQLEEQLNIIWNFGE